MSISMTPAWWCRRSATSLSGAAETRGADVRLESIRLIQVQPLGLRSLMLREKRLEHPGAAMPSCLAVDFDRRRPSPQTLDWVERVTAARVVAWRRMTGGSCSVVHRLRIDHGSYRDALVLRQYEVADS